MDFFTCLWSHINSWNWSGVTQSVTGIATLIIAWMALNSWRKQHKAQKVTGLFDELTDSIHELVQALGGPIQQLQFIRISIDSCKYDINLDKSLPHPEEICYIKKEGQESAARLNVQLKECAQPAHKIRSLLVKAQVYDIKSFENCSKYCECIVWQYDRLQVVYSILASDNLNWNHPKAIDFVDHLKNITPEDISAHLKENQIEYIKFVKGIYKKEFDSA
ncbi:hypothetical protein [Ferrimonas marina]|uniref:hypothetical protein n=1 Tax=Ferrimonas marina TaxID=299255 RepID=UPI000A975A7E|nr:hypothetical protein [Ferrimonas marina]